MALLGTSGWQECGEKGSSFHAPRFQSFSTSFFFKGKWVVGEELETKDVQ